MSGYGTTPTSIDCHPRRPLPGRAEFDPAKRHAIYDELQRTALDVVPMIGLCWRSQGYAMTRGVQGFANLTGGLNFYSGYSIENVTFAEAPAGMPLAPTRGGSWLLAAGGDVA